jgi:glycerol transport system substrate-binding protein
VPDYPKLAQLWWQNIGEAVSGEVTVDTAMDNLAKEMDKVMERIARSGTQGECGPKLNEKRRILLAEPTRITQGQAGQRKTQGRNGRLRQADQAWREGKVK